MKLWEKFTGIYGHLRFRCNCEKTFTAIYGIFRWKSFPMEHFPMQLGGPGDLRRAIIIGLAFITGTTRCVIVMHITHSIAQGRRAIFIPPIWSKQSEIFADSGGNLGLD